MSGRTDAQCRERWVNKVDPRLRPFNVWSAEVSIFVLRLLYLQQLQRNSI